jgi:hypothetical protein
MKGAARPGRVSAPPHGEDELRGLETPLCGGLDALTNF